MARSRIHTPRTGFRGVYTNKRRYRSGTFVDDQLYHIAARTSKLEAALDHDCVTFLLSDGQTEDLNFPDLPREAHLARLAEIPLGPSIRVLLRERGLLAA